MCEYTKLFTQQLFCKEASIKQFPITSSHFIEIFIFRSEIINKIDILDSDSD